MQKPFLLSSQELSEKLIVNVSHHRSFRDGSEAVDEDVTGDIDWRTWKRQNAVTLPYFFFFLLFFYFLTPVTMFSRGCVQ